MSLTFQHTRRFEADAQTEALGSLGRKRHDVIVSDMRMPGMSGAELLENVRWKHPHMIRIALSGQADRETVFKAVGPTHQYLSKPCSLETLKAVLDKVIMLRQLLGAEKLVELTSAMESLPSLPELYSELIDELPLARCFNRIRRADRIERCWDEWQREEQEPMICLSKFPPSCPVKKVLTKSTSGSVQNSLFQSVLGNRDIQKPL